MTTQKKIEKKGFKVTHNSGFRNDVQCVVSVTAEKGSIKITKPNVTQLYNIIKD